MKLLFIDTETTGLDPQVNGMIQIAGMIDIDGDVKEEFNYRMAPFKGDLVNAKALSVIGYSLDELRGFDDPAIVYGKLIKLFGKYVDKYDKRDKFHIVGQNVGFDYRFMQRFFERNNDKYLYAYIQYHQIDLIAITALFKLAGKLEGLENMKLVTVKKHFGLESKDHDALEDIRATRSIFYEYLKQLKAI